VAVPEAAPAVEPATPKKGRAPKAAKAKKPDETAKAEPPAPAGSLRAIGNGWLDHMKAKGSSASTLSSYAADLNVAHEFFGNVKAAEVTADQVAKFHVSKGVMKKANGKAKAQPTILKTRRALRLALTWAVEKKLIAKAPYAAKTPA
jgi:site-specific recombinase XerD